jgi:hypothetical protein
MNITMEQSGAYQVFVFSDDSASKSTPSGRAKNTKGVIGIVIQFKLWEAKGSNTSITNAPIKLATPRLRVTLRFGEIRKVDSPITIEVITKRNTKAPTELGLIIAKASATKRPGTQ